MCFVAMCTRIRDFREYIGAKNHNVCAMCACACARLDTYTYTHLHLRFPRRFLSLLLSFRAPERSLPPPLAFSCLSHSRVALLDETACVSPSRGTCAEEDARGSKRFGTGSVMSAVSRLCAQRTMNNTNLKEG